MGKGWKNSTLWLQTTPQETARCARWCHWTVRFLWCLEPLPNIHLNHQLLVKELQVCVNAVKFAIIASLIALGSVLKAVCAHKSALQLPMTMKDIWAESERTLRAVVDTRPSPFHHSSVSHSVSLCFVSPFHLHSIAIASFWSAPILWVSLPVRHTVWFRGSYGALVSAQCCVGSFAHRVYVWLVQTPNKLWIRVQSDSLQWQEHFKALAADIKLKRNRTSHRCGSPFWTNDLLLFGYYIYLKQWLERETAAVFKNPTYASRVRHQVA